MAALGQRVGVEIGLAAELHDASREPVGMPGLVAGMHQECTGDGRRGQSDRGEVVALVAQHADPLGGQRIVEQADDFLAPGAEMRRHGAGVQVAFRGLDAGLVQRQAFAPDRAGVV
ncbi:hypothetical protein D3C85_1646010 [compost metagenome]